MKRLAEIATDWQDEAACRTSAVDMFPGRGESTNEAKALCADCPVRWPCLAAALVQSERWGIWGGTSERERRTLRGLLRHDFPALATGGHPSGETPTDDLDDFDDFDDVADPDHRRDRAAIAAE